ncbi:MAG: hypothetical protein WEF50_18170 [Myxococcota bacterium]
MQSSVTPVAIRALARVLCAALVLALASGESRAGDLYQWVTEDGRVEIGASPPRGVAAKPWNPGQETISNPVAQPAPKPPEPAPAPAPMQRTSSRNPSSAEHRARGRMDDRCLRQQGTVAKATQKIQILEVQIARLEKKLEDLEATELAYSRTSCRSMDVYGPDASDCISSSFHRDAEIARTQEELEDAQQRLGDLEQRARSAAEDAACSPAAPEK